MTGTVRRHPTRVCHPSTKFAGSVAPQILELGRPLPRAQCTTTVEHADAGGLTFIPHGSMGMAVDIHAESGSLNYRGLIDVQGASVSGLRFHHGLIDVTDMFGRKITFFLWRGVELIR